MVKNAAAFGVYVRILSVSGKEDRYELFNNLSALLSLSGSNLGEDTANVDSHLIVVRQKSSRCIVDKLRHSMMIHAGEEGTPI